MVRTQGLTHLHLVVRDLGRSLAFYQQALGMEELFREGDTMVFLQTPGSRDLLTLNESTQEKEQAGSSGGVGHFGFRLVEGEDFDRAIAELEAAGGKLLGRGEHAPGVPYAYLSDPDGYTIELGSPRELPP